MFCNLIFLVYHKNHKIKDLRLYKGQFQHIFKFQFRCKNDTSCNFNHETLIIIILFTLFNFVSLVEKEKRLYDKNV